MLILTKFPFLATKTHVLQVKKFAFLNQKQNISNL